MAKRYIKQHLFELIDALELEPERFVALLANGTEPPVEWRTVQSWLEGCAAQERTLKRVCAALRACAESDEMRRRFGLKSPEIDLASLSPERFDSLPDVFILNLSPVAAAQAAGLAPTNTPALDVAVSAGVDDLFVMMRAIRRGAAEEPGSIAFEPLCVEPKQIGSFVTAMETRLGHFYFGLTEVIETNAFYLLRW